MTDEEIDQAIPALMAWFKSQDIPPGDAGIIMIKLIANQFVLKSSDINSLQDAVNITLTALALEIAVLIR